MNASEWIDFILPDNSNDLWTAVGALATVAVGVLAAKIAWRQLYLHSTPLLLGSRATGRTTIKNAGKSVALNVVGVDAEGSAHPIASSVRPDDEVELRRIRPTISRSEYVYYQGVLGQWFCTKLVGVSFTGQDKEYRIESRVTPVRARALPQSVRLHIKRSARSAEDHLNAITSFVTAEGWAHRFGARWKRARLRAELIWWSLGESQRVEAYQEYAHQGDSPEPPEDERTQWDVELRGMLSCWHTTTQRVLHLATVHPADGGVICQVALRSAFGGADIPGLVVITPGSWAELMKQPKSVRSDIVWEQFGRYVCGRRPKDFFVCKV